MNQLLSQFLLRLKNAIHPTNIGIAFSLWFTYTAFIHYSTKGKEDYVPPVIVEILRDAHRFSVDWRLQVRGPRKGSEQVVVLTIDEKSLEQEGQWPWPRDKIKKVIENIMDGGGAAIGFDIVFPEYDNVPTLSTLRSLKNKIPNNEKNSYLLNSIQKEYEKAQTDHILGKAVQKYADRLILGTYFEAPLIQSLPEGYQNICIQQIFERKSEAAQWDNFETVIIPLDQTTIEVSDELPDSMANILEQHLQRIAYTERERFIANLQKNSVTSKKNTQKKHLSKTSEIELDALIEEKQWRYCLRWLNKEKDEDFPSYKNAWSEITSEDESLQGLSFIDGITIFKERQLNTSLGKAGRWWMNVPPITDNTKHLAYFNTHLDKDGTIRNAPLIVHIGNRFFPSLALRTFLVANKLLAQVTLKKDINNYGYKAISHLTLTDQEGETVGSIPVTPQGFLRINYAGSQKMFSYLSAADVLSEEPQLKIKTQRENPLTNEWRTETETYNKEDFYKDKIFVFGATAVGIYDLRVTPFEENYPGVETHANLIDNMLRNDYLIDHPDEELYMFAALIILGILFSFLIGKLEAVSGVLLTSLSLLSIYLVDKFMLFKNGLVVHTVFPLILISSLYIILTAYKYFTEERNKKQLKGTFGKYVSPAIVDEILADPSNVELGGKKEHLTVFFSDIRGFTTISEKLDATSLSDLLNDYLTPMTEIIFKNKGTLDKYMGDAIMAFFGAPISYKNHAELACRSALQNISQLKILQEKYKEQGLPNIDVGIGINTGEMSVGNMGSEIVRNYTVMGDAVNLGARLEGINKQYGTRIIISQYTYNEVKDKFITREIDLVRVKGKEQPVFIYELIAEIDQQDPLPKNIESMLQNFTEGFQLYQKQQWQQAMNCFSESLNNNPIDTVSKLYLERCQEYKKTPPPKNWDGIFVMTTK